MINLILNILQKSKAINIIVLERQIGFTEKSISIISSGTSFVHINSITKNLTMFLKNNFKNIICTKSGINSDWVLIEIEDVTINVMSKDARNYYDLESLYNNAAHDK